MSDAVLNNATTTDGFTTANTLFAPNSVRVRLIVRNASIAYQYGYGDPGGALDFDSQPVKFLPPGSYSWDEAERPIDGIRVRSWVAGTPAQVTIDTVSA